MKIEELKYGEPLIVDAAGTIIPGFPSPDGSDEKGDDHFFQKVYTAILTDGEIISESDTSKSDIDEYFFGRIKYEGPVTTLLTKEIYIKDYTYIIECKIGRHWVGNGWRYWIDATKVYIYDSNDQNAKKTVKSEIKLLRRSGYYTDADVLPRKFITTYFDLGETKKQTKKRILEK